jgi:hypothetical protein
MLSLYLKIGAVVALLVAVGGAYALFQHQGHEIASLKADKASLQGYVAGYKVAQATELSIHVTQDNLRVKVENAQANIAKVDPKCSDPQPLIDSFTASVNELRGGTSSSADHSAEPARTMQGS